MKTELLIPFENLPYFTITGFLQMLRAKEANQQLVREMLSRWVKKGHIIRLKKGVYMTRRFYDINQNHPSFQPAVSAIILPQSYVSLDYVLQINNILTEATYPVTAVTLKNKKVIQNILGTFSYRHIKKNLYKGFSDNMFFGVIFNQASLAKALFDYFYFRPLPRELQSNKYNLSEEFRLNLYDIPSETIEEFTVYIELSNSPKMNFILNNLRSHEWHL